MVLSEEYVERHKIKIPLVVHPQCSGGSSLLLRRTGDWRFLYPGPWVIMHINWIENNHRPGQYSMRFYSPLADACSRRETFSSLEDILACSYDDFDKFMINYVNNLKGFRAISGESIAIQVSCWEMFCHCYDRYLSTCSPSSKLMVKVEKYYL